MYIFTLLSKTYRCGGFAGKDDLDQ